MKTTISPFIKIIIICACFFVGILNLHSQDFIFSDYRNIPTLQNSANVGSGCGPRITLFGQSIHRSTILNPTYRTAGLNFDMPIKLKKDYRIGIGYRYYNDIQGNTLGLTGNVIGVSFTKKIIGTKVTQQFSIGIEGGINQRTINDNDLRWPSQIGPNGFDPTLPTGQPDFKNEFIHGDVNLGVKWNATFFDKTNITIGASFNHINTPNISFLGNDVDQKIFSNFHILVDKPITDKINLLPSAYFVKQGPHDVYNISLAAKFEKNGNLNLLGGIGYNKNRQPFITAGIEFKKVSVGMNYNFNNLAKMHKYELTVSYQFKKCE